MNPKVISTVFLMLALCPLLSYAGQLKAELLAPVEALEQVGGKDQPKPPDKEKKDPGKAQAEPPKTDIFAQAPAMGNQFPTGFNPNMMGDFSGFFVRQVITIQGVKTTTTTTTIKQGEPPVNITKTTTVLTPFTETRTVLVPVPSSGSAFKVGENSSPRPQDRAFFTYHYFSGLRDSQNGPVNTVDATQTTTVNGQIGAASTAVNTFIPGSPRATANLHRETLGFEKTFLDGFASIELRLPLLQQSSNLPGFSSSNVGDLTIIGKYAFILDPISGNVLSAGLAVTAPTGPGVVTSEGNIHSTLLQPWGGYILNYNRFFIQGFHSVVVPTDARDVTLLFNDVSFNLWLYRGGPNSILNFIVPTLEAHVTTPLNHRDLNGPFLVYDLVVMTGGVHLGLFQNATISFGCATPVNGPRPYAVEGFMQLNWRF